MTTLRQAAQRRSCSDQGRHIEVSVILLGLIFNMIWIFGA